MGKSRWSRKFWRRYAAFAGLLAAGETAICIPTHAWPQLGISLGSTAVTAFFSRVGFKAAAEREAHHPDYAKIAQLEIELGLVDPPKPPPSPMKLATNLFAPKPSPQTREVYPACRLCGSLNVMVHNEGCPADWCRQCGQVTGHARWCSRYRPPPPPALRMPDHRCSLCIPGRPAANCPFNSICQK